MRVRIYFSIEKFNWIEKQIGWRECFVNTPAAAAKVDQVLCILWT